MAFPASKPPLPPIKDTHIALIAPLLQSKSVTIARQYLRYWVVIIPIVTVSIILTMVDLYGAQNEAYMSRSAEKWVRGLCFNELGVCS